MMQNLAAVEIGLFVRPVKFLQMQSSYKGAAIKAFSAHLPNSWSSHLRVSG